MDWGRRLLERFRSGETAALRRFGAGAAGWPTIADDLGDLVQEVFARAFHPRTRRSFDGLRDYGPFLSQIARNVTVDHLRRHSRYVWAGGGADFDRLFDRISMQSAPVPDANDDFAERETLALVARYLAALPSELQRAYDLLYVRGLSERDAAVALGVGRQVIRTLGARLRDGLRAHLADRKRPDDEVEARQPSADIHPKMEIQR